MVKQMIVVLEMNPEIQSRRSFTYVLWMLGVVCIPIGLSFETGSGLQLIFIGLSIGLFALSRAIFTTTTAR